MERSRFRPFNRQHREFLLSICSNAVSVSFRAKFRSSFEEESLKEMTVPSASRWQQKKSSRIHDESNTVPRSPSRKENLLLNRPEHVAERKFSRSIDDQLDSALMEKVLSRISALGFILFISSCQTIPTYHCDRSCVCLCMHVIMVQMCDPQRRARAPKLTRKPIKDSLPWKPRWTPCARRWDIFVFFVIVIIISSSSSWFPCTD